MYIHNGLEKNIQDLFLDLEKPYSRVELKNDILLLNRKYLNGLKESKIYNLEIHKALKTLIKVSEYVISNFYNLEDIEKKKIKPLFEFKKNFFKYSSIKPTKFPHLINFEFFILDKFRKFSKNNKKKIEKINTLIPIGNGGFEPTYLIKSFIPNSEILPTKYSCVREKENEIFIPEYYKNNLEKLISNKNILICEDVIQTGKTMKDMISFLEKFSPQRIETFCVFKKKPINFKKI